MEYAGNRASAVRALTGYCRASRVGESRIFSPTQSLSRLIARSFGSRGAAVPAAGGDQRRGGHEAQPKEVAAREARRPVSHGSGTGRDTSP